MLSKKGDPTCVKMIDFGLSKDFSGTGSMKTMSGSVSQIRSELFLNHNILALLHRSRSVPAELQLEDWYLVNGSSPLHHA